MSTAFVDRPQLHSLLLAGEKVATVANVLGCQPPSVSTIAHKLGLQLAWTTPEERRLLAALRAFGQGIGDDPAESIAFFEAVGRLLRTYQSTTRKEAA